MAITIKVCISSSNLINLTFPAQHKLKSYCKWWRIWRHLWTKTYIACHHTNTLPKSSRSSGFWTSWTHTYAVLLLFQAANICFCFQNTNWLPYTNTFEKPLQIWNRLVRNGIECLIAFVNQKQVKTKVEIEYHLFKMISTHKNYYLSHNSIL